MLGSVQSARDEAFVENVVYLLGITTRLNIFMKFYEIRLYELILIDYIYMSN